jgi:hypothetical protein
MGLNLGEGGSDPWLVCELLLGKGGLTKRLAMKTNQSQIKIYEANQNVFILRLDDHQDVIALAHEGAYCWGA